MKNQQQQQIKININIIIILILLIIILIIINKYLDTFELLNILIKNKINMQIIHLDSSEVWIIDNPSRPSTIMTLDKWFSELIKGPSNEGLNLVNVYPNDLYELKPLYLDPLWIEYVSQYFDIHQSELLKHENDVKGILNNFWEIKNNQRSIFKYMPNHFLLNDLWYTLKYDSVNNLNNNNSNKGILLDLYISSHLSEWELINIQNGVSLNLKDIWPENGIKLPILSDKHYYYKELYTWSDKKYVDSIVNVHDLDVHKRIIEANQNVKLSFKSKFIQSLNQLKANKLCFSHSTIEKYHDVLDYYSSSVGEKLRMKKLLKVFNNKNQEVISDCSYSFTTISSYEIK